MTKYEVNKPFPYPHPRPGMEITLSELNEAFFDVKAYLSDPTPDEIRDWRKGKLRYGLYFQDDIPFFILAFENWDLDININILKVKKGEDIDKWLNAEGNIINLYLIDARTNILKAMRTISVSLNCSEGIRDVLEMQSQNYDSVQEVDTKIYEIQNSLTTHQMRSKGKMYKL